MLKLIGRTNRTLDDTRVINRNNINDLEYDLLFYLYCFQYTCDTKEELIDRVRDDLERAASMRNMTLEDYFNELIERYPYNE